MKHTTDDYETVLIQKGYVQDATGDWHKPRRVGAAPGAVPERATEAASHGQASRGQGRSKSVGRRPALSPVARVVFVAVTRPGRAARHDGDNWRGGIEASLKPLRDAIARSFGLDDHESTIAWEYRTVEAEGEEGVFVRVEVLT